MKYYYFPSTFFGFRGRGYYGGGYTGYGYMVKGGSAGEIVDVKAVDPEKLKEVLPPGDKALLKGTEETGSPTDMPKKNWDWWNILGKIGTAATEGVKGVASATGSFIKNTGWGAKDLMEAYNLYKNPVGALERIATTGIKILPKFFNPFGGGNYSSRRRRRIRGRGVCNMLGCGRPHLVKGSPEAKQYMAYLRSLRRK